MKILSITTQKPHSTGSGTYLTELVHSFHRKGIRQAVVAGIYPRDTVTFPKEVSFYPVYYRMPDANSQNPHSSAESMPSEESREPNAPTLSFPVLGMSDTMPYPSTRYSQLTEPQLAELESAFCTAVGQAVRELQPDVILCHHLFLLTAILRKHFPDQKIYGICHGSDLRQMRNLLERTSGYQSSPLSALPISQRIQELDGIFALHSVQKTQIEKFHRVPAHRITVIGTGYNGSIFCPSAEPPKAKEMEEPFRFIYAGKICREKGIAELLEALQLLSTEATRPFQLHLAGGCKDSDIAAQLTGDSQQPLVPGPLSAFDFPIYYHGLMSQPDLADLYRQCDAFVLPSYYEGLPLVLIEAMACGLSTLCTDLPGVQNWLREEIPHYNTVFLPLPRMISADQPDPDALPEYIFTLKEKLKGILTISGKSSDPRPDTSGATWDGVADRILLTV